MNIIKKVIFSSLVLLSVRMEAEKRHKAKAV